jgi:cytochrome c oxidase cbb3-type subunit 3
MPDTNPHDTPTPDPDLPNDPLTGHNYDGIQEYDNPTPSWWTYLFVLSCLFAPVYMVFTLMSDGSLTPEGQYERAVVANLVKKFGEIGELQPDAPTLMQYSQDPEWLAFGENVFRGNCASCHGTNAAGTASAPNLTDNKYINITHIEDIASVVTNGAKGGAMPAWGNRLHPNEIVMVSAYVASLRGTGGDGAGADGEVPPPWDAE